MSTTLINFANKNFRQQQYLSALLGKIHGKFDNVICYAPKHLDSHFVQKNIDIFSLKRGFGYWLWKPYLILKTLNAVRYGDWVVYSDSGSFFINSVKNILNEIECFNQDVVGFELPLIERQWTKRELFISMECDDSFFKDSNQIHASIQFVKKSKFSLEFYKEYLNIAQSVINLTDECDYSVDQDPFFIEHRHDQSIYSLLYKKNNLITFKDPTQYGDDPFSYAACTIEKVPPDIVHQLPNGRYFRYHSFAQKYGTVIYQYRRAPPLRSYISVLRHNFISKYSFNDW